MVLGCATKRSGSDGQWSAQLERQQQAVRASGRIGYIGYEGPGSRRRFALTLLAKQKPWRASWRATGEPLQNRSVNGPEPSKGCGVKTVPARPRRFAHQAIVGQGLVLHKLSFTLGKVSGEHG